MYLPSLVLWSLLLQVTATWQARYADALTGFHPPWANGACLLVQCEAAHGGGKYHLAELQSGSLYILIEIDMGTMQTHAPFLPWKPHHLEVQSPWH